MPRRLAREIALQAMFQVDLVQSDPLTAINYLLEKGKLPVEEEEELSLPLTLKEDNVTFIRELVFGILKHQAVIDDIIASLSRDWPLPRLAVVDRNIIRLALYELLYRDDVPPQVVANEAVELAKKYGGDNSGKFVNGIVGRVVLEREKYRQEIKSN